MPESKHQEIEDTIVSRLAGIVGDGGVNYWLTPDRVIRYAGFTEQCLDPSLTTVYVLSPDEEEDREAATGTDTSGPRVKSGARLDLVLATKYEGTDNPFESGVTVRGTLQNRMARDVKKKLREPPTIEHGLKIMLTDRSPDNTYHPKWAIVLMRALVEYSYPAVTP